MRNERVERAFNDIITQMLPHDYRKAEVRSDGTIILQYNLSPLYVNFEINSDGDLTAFMVVPDPVEVNGSDPKVFSKVKQIASVLRGMNAQTA